MIFRREPALVLAAALAVLELAIGFGLQITTHQETLIMGAAGAVLSLLTGAGIRTQVTPARR